MKEPKTAPRVAAYLRQSLDVTEGIERQDSRTAQLIQLRGWTYAGRYADNDTSASKKRGPDTAWGRLLDDIRADRIDVVVAVDLDRLVRSTRDLLTLIDLGVRVVTVDGEIDLTTADGEFRATMLAAMARFEVRRKSERQKRANEFRARQGRYYGGRRAFGYEADGMTVIPAEAAAVSAGYEALLAGEPLAVIARSWNAQGFTTGQQRQARSGHAGEESLWNWGNVRTALSNPRYAGIVRYQGEVLDVPAQWPAIVSESTYRAALAILEDPARRRAPRGDRYLLSGLARCGVCGSEVHAAGNARRGVRGYRCKGSMGHFSRMAEPIEEFVSRVVVQQLARTDPDLFQTPVKSNADALNKEAARLRKKLDTIMADYEDEVITRSQFLSSNQRLRESLAAVERELADAGKVDVLGVMVGAEDVQATWDALDLNRKRAIIDALMTVTIHPVGRGRRWADDSVTTKPRKAP